MKCVYCPHIFWLYALYSNQSRHGAWLWSGCLCHLFLAGSSGSVVFTDLTETKRTPFTISASGDLASISRQFRIGKFENYRTACSYLFEYSSPPSSQCLVSINITWSLQCAVVCLCLQQETTLGWRDIQYNYIRSWRRKSLVSCSEEVIEGALHRLQIVESIVWLSEYSTTWQWVCGWWRHCYGGMLLLLT